MILTDKIKEYVWGEEKRWEMGLFLVCLGFYLIFPFYDGPVWCKDSSSYTTMDITREPLYPTLLWIFRKIFGEADYLMPVVIAQSILAAYATWKLAVTIKKYKEDSRFLAMVSVCFQCGVVLLNRFVALRGSSYTVSIMTEGLGFPLYILFIIQLYQYILKQKRKNLAGTVCLAAMLVSLRKQMLMTLCLMAAIFILYYLIKKREVRKLLCLLLLTVGLFGGTKLADRFYNYCVRGEWIEHSGNSMGMLCTLVYTSQEGDAALFRDEALKQLYEEIYASADERALNIAYAPKGWVGLTTHYADCYDDIGYGIINPVIQGYVVERHGDGYVNGAIWFDAYCTDIAKTLIGQKKGKLCKVVAANIWKGFVNSIARVNLFLNVYALLAYLLYIGLYIGKIYARRCWGEPDATLTLAEIVLGGVIINCGVVGITIFTQPRYMIYNMGLFYCVLEVLLYDMIRDRRKKRNHNRQYRMKGIGKGNKLREMDK